MEHLGPVDLRPIVRPGEQLVQGLGRRTAGQGNGELAAGFDRLPGRGDDSFRCLARDANVGSGKDFDFGDAHK